MAIERGAFRHLDHLWLPPVGVLAAPPRNAHFKHAILHRSFEVRVETKTVTVADLDRLATRRSRGVERRVVAPDGLAALGRSSLLTKSLRHG